MSFHGAATYVTRAIPVPGQDDVPEDQRLEFEILNGGTDVPASRSAGLRVDRGELRPRKIALTQLDGQEIAAMSSRGKDQALKAPKDQEIPDDARLYDRIVRSPDPADVTPCQLIDLASKVSGWQTRGSGDMPAGLNYFAQFVAHELSRLRDTGSSGPNRWNWTTPAFDLASLFGETPEAPWREGAQPDFDRDRHLVIGNLALGKTDKGHWEDLPRDADGRAEIPESRNDSNLALAQIHVALIKFHQVVAMLEPWDARTQRRITRRHLQSIVLHDLLPRLVPIEIYRQVMGDGRSIIAPDEPSEFLTSLEFAAACFRFGHSMVRGAYLWSGTLSMSTGDLLRFTHFGGGIANAEPFKDTWRVDWSTLIDLAGPPDHGMAIDGTTNYTFGNLTLANVLEPTEHEKVALLSHLPPDAFDISALTLLRGDTSWLPNARQVWERVREALPGPGSPPADLPISDRALCTLTSVDPDLADRPPLWLHMIDEAMGQDDSDASDGGERCKLGPLSGLIVAETLHAAVAAAPDSILNAEGRSDFTVLPALRGAYPDRFSFADLLRAVHLNWKPPE